MTKRWTFFGLFILGTFLYAEGGADLATKYGCMTCHRIRGKKNAPAFRGIANRNLRFGADRAKEAIIRSIRNGSREKYPAFGGAKMPAYPDLSETELDTLADWILSQARQGGGMGRGRGTGGF